MGCEVKNEQCKRDFRKQTTTALKGNALWAWTMGPFTTPETVPDDQDDQTQMIKYMSKGIHDPKYNKGYTQEYIDHCRSLWISDADFKKSAKEKNPQSSEKSSEKKSDAKTLYAVGKEIIAEAKSHPGIFEQKLCKDVDDQLTYQESCVRPDRLYNIMLIHLDKNKVRTSIHELERMFLTMIRNDPYQKENFRKTIFSRLNIT